MLTLCLSTLSAGFEFDFNALYMQPLSNNLHYVAEAIPLPAPTPHWIIDDIHPNFHFGFDIGAAYVCCDRCTKVQGNYVRLHSHDSASKVTSTENMVGPFFEIGPDAIPYNKAKGKVHSQYDAANLEGGMRLNFNCVRATFFSGVAFARIKQTLTSTYSNTELEICRTIKVPTSFIGAGPRFGCDFSYPLFCSLELTGKSAAALLVGKEKNHTSYASVSPALVPLDITPPNQQSTTVDNRTIVVPAWEGKLGLGYTFCWCCCQGSLEAGYQVLFYHNAIQSIDMGSEVVTPPVVPDTVGVFARTFQRNMSDFALAGPYIAVSAGF